VGSIEVATFRRDAGYSDGRHPDAVEFCDERADASRRDFTINGLFLDPLTDSVIDYVGGRQDLGERLIRAIGDAEARIGEDKLRMLRAVRFAAAFDFAIESGTWEAIRRRAAEIVAVSAERIAEELRRMLTAPSRRRAVELLASSGLLEAILPEYSESQDSGCSTLDTALAVLARLPSPSFTAAFAALIRGRIPAGGGRDAPLSRLFQRMKLSAREGREISLFLEQEGNLRDAERIPWPRLQRILAQPLARELLDYAESVACVVDGSERAIQYCRRQMDRPTAEWNPPPLVTGHDLISAGAPAGPVFAAILESVRDAQLEGRVRTREQALAMVRQRIDAGRS
jgi:tRNA nucleotidyltransferase/poly(A) polymerase